MRKMLPRNLSGQYSEEFGARVYQQNIRDYDYLVHSCSLALFSFSSLTSMACFPVSSCFLTLESQYATLGLRAQANASLIVR